MSILIVVAHPDDEVLGCGATGAAYAANGRNVRACMLSGRASARADRPDDEQFRSDIARAQEILGFGPAVLGDFPNLELNRVPHLELVQFIEQAIETTEADMIFTHHPADLNDDHKHVSAACQEAARLFQRRGGIKPLKSLYFMEISSSTDWSFRGNGSFSADAFYETGEENLSKKTEALMAYRGVMRSFPHPRSPEVIRGLAAVRGAQAGMLYAEAFQTAFSAMSRI